MGAIIPRSRLRVGQELISDTFDAEEGVDFVFRTFLFPDSSTVQSNRINVQETKIKVYVEGVEDPTYPRLLVSFTLEDLDESTVSVAFVQTKLRVRVQCLSGSGIVESVPWEREIPLTPPNLELTPGAVLHVDSNGEINTLPPPPPNYYLGTNGLGQFGYFPIPTGTLSYVQVRNEVPMGPINGINKVFFLVFTPDPIDSLDLYRNGLFMSEGIDYTLSGNMITYNDDSTPLVGSAHIASYSTTP